MKRYPGLDLLRAIAILWVMLFHAMTEGLGSPLRPVGQLGWIGVDLFFVLSGYLIGSQVLKPYSQGKTPTIGSFYLRRAFRILPTYWVILIFYFCIPVFREAKGIQPFWQFLTFTENFLIDYQHNQAFSHAWSLCVEEHFYLVFPLLVWALMRRPSRKSTTAVCLAIFFGGMLLRAYVWLHYIHSGNLLLGRPRSFVELIYYPTCMRLDGLLVGVILAAVKWYRPNVWARAMNSPYFLLGAGLLSMSAAIWMSAGRTSFAASVFGFPFLSVSIALLVAASVSSRCLLGRIHVLGAKGIATITFSLYLMRQSLAWLVLDALFTSLLAVSQCGINDGLSCSVSVLGLVMRL